MKKSESIVELSKALSKFQGEVENPKNTSTNPFYKSKYAPLEEVLNTVRPALADNGLSVTQIPTIEGDKVGVVTILMHSSGEYIETEPLLFKADKNTAQGAGSAITYARRYALSAILGVASEEDDDGNNAEPNKQQKKNQYKNKDQQAKPNKEVARLKANPAEALEVEITFGEEQGNKLGEITKRNPTYIDWLIKEAEDDGIRMAAMIMKKSDLYKTSMDKYMEGQVEKE